MLAATPAIAVSCPGRGQSYRTDRHPRQPRPDPTVFSSPGVPGARPSNASDASVLTVADILGALIGDCDAAMADIDAREAAASSKARTRFTALLPSRYCLQLDPFASILATHEHMRHSRERHVKNTRLAGNPRLRIAYGNFLVQDSSSTAILGRRARHADRSRRLVSPHHTRRDRG